VQHRKAQQQGEHHPGAVQGHWSKKGDNHDRYHGFDLYKAIARYLKESAVPRKELTKFGRYAETAPPGIPILVIGD
jgi:hypothetical protein